MVSFMTYTTEEDEDTRERVVRHCAPQLRATRDAQTGA